MNPRILHPYFTVYVINANAFIGAALTWLSVSLHAACDTGAGEVYLQTSSKNVPSLKQCKKLCETSTECHSVTYFKSGWCSHFSTTCTNTKWQNDAMALQVNRNFDSVSIGNARTTATQRPRAAGNTFCVGSCRLADTCRKHFPTRVPNGFRCNAHMDGGWV